MSNKQELSRQSWSLVRKLWNYCNVLRDAYGLYKLKGSDYGG